MKYPTTVAKQSRVGDTFRRGKAKRVLGGCAACGIWTLDARKPMQAVRQWKVEPERFVAND